MNRHGAAIPYLSAPRVLLDLLAFLEVAKRDALEIAGISDGVGGYVREDNPEPAA